MVDNMKSNEEDKWQSKGKKRLHLVLGLIKKVMFFLVSLALLVFAVFNMTELSLAQIKPSKLNDEKKLNTPNQPRLSFQDNDTVEKFEKLSAKINTKKISPPAEPHPKLLKRIPYDEVKSGSLFFKSEHGYYSQLSQNSDYRVEVNGLLARVYFSQTFTNDSDQFLEAVYVFPLSDDAAVDAMVMEIGERRILGSIKEKKHAKKLYQQAKAQGKKASLVSQQRPNMFTTKVANIAPHESIKISLSYLQAVNFSNDEFSLRLPLTITPRYIVSAPVNSNATQSHQTVNKLLESSKNENTYPLNPVIDLNQAHGWVLNNTRVVDASEITPPQVYSSKGQKANIVIKINSALALANVNSQYHQVSKSRVQRKSNESNNHSVVVKLKGNNILLDQDFELHWQLAQGQTPQAAFFTDTDDKYNYGLLMLMPPNEGLGEVIAKEVVYIIDTSGSMGGVAIKQAKTALIQAMDYLNAEDTFNIIAFNDQTRQLFRDSKVASEGNRIQAKRWISQLQAGGGTDMLPALTLALDNNHSSKASEKPSHRQVIFITDGAVGNEAELFNIIEDKLQATRLHTVGIGSAPNGYFMRQAAEVGRGTYRYIGKINEVEQQMQQLFDEISRPMMADIRIDWPSQDVEIFPNEIPDLYAGQPLVISAKWAKLVVNKQNGLATVTVSGNLAAKPWQQSIAITAVEKSNNKKPKFNGISTWWGRQKIKHLSRQFYRSFGEQQEQLQQQITELAIKHSLLSKFTSFVAIEEKISRPKNSNLKSQAIANLMPKGSIQALPLANTALGLAGYLYLGAVMLIITIFLALLSLPHWLILRLNRQSRLKKEQQLNTQLKKQLTDFSK
ncbi:MAG: marine proteobacterial sortase target protein [Colwellia sp.]|nr:marine proteobacterial sortase target protein [Colwellia sp.]